MGCSTSNQLDILVLIGSNRKSSNNRGLVQSLINSKEFKDFGINVHVPDISEIPFFNEDLEKQKNIPSSVNSLKKLCKKSQLILFVTPEYNGAVSATVKNAYDWLSRPDPQFDNKAIVAGKCAAIMSTSYISQGQVKDCQKMGQYWKLRYFNRAYYINLGSGAFDAKGNLAKQQQKKNILAWGGQVVQWVTQNK